MENAEEILQCLDEFAKLKPKDIPRELEDYLCFVAKTGDPVYQWPLIKCLFREKLISVITEFYEACPSVEIPPCPNVDAFNYDAMKGFILEKLDTFAAAPFTVQRICELLTAPRKEYNRIDKYMRALEKNILVVSTREPGNRKAPENGESVVNGLESEHVAPDAVSSDINVEVEMDETAVWPKAEQPGPYVVPGGAVDAQAPTASDAVQDAYVSESAKGPSSSSIETVITPRPLAYIGYTPNITDLIVEPAATPASEPTAPTPSNETPGTPVEQPAQPAAVDSSAAFAMSTEPIDAPAPSTAEPVASVDCSDSACASATPEPSEVHVDQPPELVEQTGTETEGEPTPSDAPVDAQPSEPTAQSTPEHTADSSAAVEAQPSCRTEPEPSADYQVAQPTDTAEQSNETAISSTDEQRSAEVSSACAAHGAEPGCTADEQVAEASSSASECEVSQTDTKVAEASQPERSEVAPETSTSSDVADLGQTESTESMDVDETPLQADATASPSPAPAPASPAPTEPSDGN